MQFSSRAGAAGAGAETGILDPGTGAGIVAAAGVGSGAGIVAAAGVGAAVTVAAEGAGGDCVGNVCIGSGAMAPHLCSASVARYCWRDCRATTSLPAAF